MTTCDQFDLTPCRSLYRRECQTAALSPWLHPRPRHRPAQPGQSSPFSSPACTPRTPPRLPADCPPAPTGTRDKVTASPCSHRQKTANWSCASVLSVMLSEMCQTGARWWWAWPPSSPPSWSRPPSSPGTTRWVPRPAPPRPAQTLIFCFAGDSSPPTHQKTEHHSRHPISNINIVGGVKNLK